ncbi:MAG: FxsA family protein [Rhizobiales bacterium]|nr:FxsA family protein [Hyphomicrobiales bacterium]
MLSGETVTLRFFPLILIGGIAAEIWVFIKAGEAFGALTVVLAVIAAMFAGAAIIRRQGIRTLNGLRGALNGGSLREVNAADGALIYVAGLLLILPGFLSDIAAIALLLPPVRHLIVGRLRSHVTVSEAHMWAGGRRPSPSPVIEGEAVDVTGQPVRDAEAPIDYEGGTVVRYPDGTVVHLDSDGKPTSPWRR